MMYSKKVFAIMAASMVVATSSGLYLDSSSSSASSPKLVLLSRRNIVTGAAAAAALSLPVNGVASAAGIPPSYGPMQGLGGRTERVPGIGGGFDMLTDKPISTLDILYPPSLNGTWVCERRVVSVEGDALQAQGAWKLLGGTGDVPSMEKYNVRFIDLRRTSDAITGLDGKRYYGDILDRGYEIEQRTGGAGGKTEVNWDGQIPNVLKYQRAPNNNGGGPNPTVELKVVQRNIELPSAEKGGWGSNELIRVTTKTNVMNFDVTYAVRVQRRWRRTATEEGDRLVEGLEIIKTYRVLDGIAGIEMPTSTLKSTIRLTRTYPTRPPTSSPAEVVESEKEVAEQQLSSAAVDDFSKTTTTTS